MVGDISRTNYTTMRKQILTGIGLLTTIMLLGSLRTLAQAQIVVDILEDTDNSLLLQLSNKDGISRPDKILFIYDSNVITLESSDYQNVHSYSEINPYINSSSVNFALAEEIERDIEIEAWMLRPFRKEYFQECLLPQKEEEIAVEPWMTDLKQWKL